MYLYTGVTLQAYLFVCFFLFLPKYPALMSTPGPSLPRPPLNFQWSLRGALMNMLTAPKTPNLQDL